MQGLDFMAHPLYIHTSKEVSKLKVLLDIVSHLVMWITKESMASMNSESFDILYHKFHLTTATPTLMSKILKRKIFFFSFQRPDLLISYG
jgi:hypothetical protein